MSHGPDLGEYVSVSEGAVTVDKSFETDEFPVPAVVFEITSTSDEPVDIRLTDEIPESFPMEKVGFHPDFESDRWTAYKEHYVEYVRTLSAGEELTTVYGVRLDDTDEEPSDFLGRPSIELLAETPDTESVEEIVGADNNQVVRDVVSGESDTVPGMDDDEAPALDFDDPLDDPLDDTNGSEESSSDDPLDDPLAAETAELSIDDPQAEEGSEELSLEEPSDDPLADDGEEELSLEDPLDDPTADDSPADESETDELDADEPLTLEDPSDESASEDDDSAVESDDSDSRVPRSLGSTLSPAIAARDFDAEPLVGAVGNPVDGADTRNSVAEDGESTNEESTDEYVEIEDEVDQSVSDADDEPTDIEDEPMDSDHESTDAGRAADESVAPAVASGGIAAALASEIREGNVDEDDLDLLRSELDFGVPNSVDVRIGRLQSQMGDLAAYADALEAFIDEEGEGAEMVRDLRGQVDSLSGELDELQGTVEEMDDAREDLRRDIESVDADVDALESQVDADETKLAGLDEELGEVRDDIADLDTDTTATRDDVDALRDDLGVLRNDLEEQNADTEAEMEALRSEVESLREEVVDLRSFRDRLGDAFGA